MHHLTTLALAAAPVLCEAARLLATLIQGAASPLITGEEATIEARVPGTFLDAYRLWIGRRHAVDTETAAPGASGAWSGVLLPAQREAVRLLEDLFALVEVIAPLPSGGYRVRVRCTLATHDRLALWGASLGAVSVLFETPPPPAPACASLADGAAPDRMPV